MLLGFRYYCLLLLLWVAILLGTSNIVVAEEFLPPILESKPETVSSASAVPSGSISLPIEARVTRLERLMEGQALVDMMMRLESLQREVQELRGELESQAHNIDGIKKRQRDLYLDIDRRLQQAEKSGMPVPGEMPGTPNAASPTLPTDGLPSSSSTGTAPGQTGAPVNPLEEQNAYESALNILQSGRFDEGIKEFQNYLARYPEGDYAGNAHFWLGQANFITRRYPAAIEHFNVVITSHPNSAKIPESMQKIGFCFYELKKWQKAKEVLSDVVTKYPKTTAAKLAQDRLHRMKLEGK
ncbi:MAG: tol-pal system protein YbgF [Gammaproteobacteria bacterium]